jgi:hypothetical protein
LSSPIERAPWSILVQEPGARPVAIDAEEIAVVHPRSAGVAGRDMTTTYRNRSSCDDVLTCTDTPTAPGSSAVRGGA